MTSSSRRRAALSTLAIGATLAVTGSLVAGSANAAPAATDESATATPALTLETELTDGTYVVQLADAPAASYDGGVRGMRATAADDGEFDARSAESVAYREYLLDQQDEKLADVGAEAMQQYTVVNNGFSAELTAQQAEKLSADRGVLSIQKDEVLSVDTITSPEFLGLEGPEGIWEQYGGTATAGEGVVVGVLDSGYWPENESFAGFRLANSRAVTASRPGPAIDISRRDFRDADAADTAFTHFYKGDGGTFRGACEGGEGFSRRDCNTKVISARYFPEGFLASVPEANRGEFEFISTRDGDSHGSHTASTAAGNHGVDMELNERVGGEGSGMAPAAKLAIYKVCWEDDDPDTGGCYTQDIIAAINQAVEDNVDVINYSISGTLNNPLDAVELAYLNAADAGIFVAASAGNSGPGSSTVAHPSPWLTTVAASTHSVYESTLTLGDGTELTGASVATEEVDAGLVSSVDIAAEGVAAADAAICLPGSLDAAGADGMIVVCDRGVSDRVEKSAVVAAAGGVGMVLANVEPGQSLDADFHTVPTVHVDDVAGATVKAYVADTEAPTATITPGVDPEVATPTPQTAGFSSRGPGSVADGDLLKPDITGPGVSVLAAVAPGPNDGLNYNLLSGTSMSSPHVAGLAALLISENPDWSPMAVKSAMMTTAYDIVGPDGETLADPFAQGAGHVDPTRFYEPGLVYDSDVDDWLDYLAGQGALLGDGTPVSDTPIEARNLNTPSIAIGELAGPGTVTRTVTALEAGTYSASVDGLAGMDVTVTPSEITLAAGESATFEVAMVAGDDAEVGEYISGSLTWSGPTEVRIPVVVRPVSVSAPAEVTAAVSDGSVSFDVVSGTNQEIGTEVAGLVAGEATDGSLVPGPTFLGSNASNLGTIETIDEGTTLARFDLDAVNDADDLDLFVYRFTGPSTVALVAQSATASADERVDLLDPAPGDYFVLANSFSVETPGTPSAFTYTSFAVSGDEGNLTLDPSVISAEPAESVSLTASWTDLDASQPYLGWIGYEGALSPTVVSLEADG